MKKTRSGVKTKIKTERRKRTMRRSETKKRRRNKIKTRNGKKTDPKRQMKNGRRRRSPEHPPEVTMHHDDLVVPAGKGGGGGAGVLPGLQEHQRPSKESLLDLRLPGAEIRKRKREKKNGTTSVTGEKESVLPPQKRVLATETGRRKWRREPHQIRRRNTVKSQMQL